MVTEDVLRTVRLLCLGAATFASTMTYAEEAASQLPTRLPVRVRLAQGDRTLTYELVRATTDGLIVRKPGRIPEPETTLAFRNIGRAEWSAGRSRGRSALKGAMFGFAAGAVVGVILDSGCKSECYGAFGTAVILGVPAAVLGTGIGAAVATERWKPLDVHALPGAAPAQTNREGGLVPAIRVTFRF